jgi:hypothetical protein
MSKANRKLQQKKQEKRTYIDQKQERFSISNQISVTEEMIR